MYATISLADIKAVLSAPNNSSDYATIANNFYVGSGCYVGQLYRTLYRISGTGQTLSPVTIPQNWAFQEATESYFYVVSNNLLYRFNQAQNQYDQIYSFSSFNKYFLYEYKGRIIVSASNNIDDASVRKGTFHVNQSIFCFADTSSGLKLIGRVDFEGYNSLDYVAIFISPRLTKIGYEYTPLGNSSLTIVAKSIDYLSNQVLDLIWKDLPHFL